MRLDPGRVYSQTKSNPDPERCTFKVDAFDRRTPIEEVDRSLNVVEPRILDRQIVLGRHLEQ
jgi:hypothetical protein